MTSCDVLLLEYRTRWHASPFQHVPVTCHSFGCHSFCSTVACHSFECRLPSLTSTTPSTTRIPSSCCFCSSSLVDAILTGQVPQPVSRGTWLDNDPLPHWLTDPLTGVTAIGDAIASKNPDGNISESKRAFGDPLVAKWHEWIIRPEHTKGANYEVKSFS